MADKLINLDEFTSKLKTYRDTLVEMNKLTEEEIKHVSSIGFSLKNNENESEKEAANFINKQMCSYLEKLVTLANSIPNYTVHGCFTTEEIENLQQRALQKLKELGSNPSENKLIS